MAAAIKMISEQEIGLVGAQGTAPSAVAKPNGADPASLDPRILGAFTEAGNRLSALEQTVQNVPRSAAHVALLIRALGARVLAFLGLLGCLGLAFELGTTPGWQGLTILGIVVVGVQLPLVASAYWGRQ